MVSSEMKREVTCFICGFHSSEFITINSQPDNNKPFFPFLLNQDPAEGSAELTDKGTAIICTLCNTFLMEQWTVYEDGMIHRQKRLYWMKRPEVCRKFTSREKTLLKKLVVMDTQDSIAENGVKPLGELVFSNLKSSTFGYLTRSLSKTPNSCSETSNNGVVSTGGPLGRSPVNMESFASGVSLVSLRKQANDEEISCYLCNDKLLFSERKIILTDAPPERNTSTRYFPCFQNIKPPHATKIHIKNGDIFACSSCDEHLKSQWVKYEKAEIPVALRVYALRYSDHSFCYCCGSIFASHGNDLSLTCDICYTTYCQMCRQPNKSKEKMSSVRLEESDEFKSLAKFFPQKVRRTTACEKCMGFLLIQKNYYDQHKISLNSRTYTLPTAIGLIPNCSQKQIVCYLCGEGYKSNGKIYYLFGDKQAGDANDKMPFFPLLKNLNPAEGANIVTKDGMIYSCRFCYHNLISQWNWYELAKDSRPKSMRSYSLNICCVICTKSVARPKVRVIGKSQFPFLTKIESDPRCIVLDNFDTVVVCNPCERTLVMQWLDYEKRCVVNNKRDYQVAGKTFKFEVEAKSITNVPTSDVSESSRPSTGRTTDDEKTSPKFPTNGVFASGTNVSPQPANHNVPSLTPTSTNQKPGNNSLPSNDQLILQAAAAMYPVALHPYILNASKYLNNSVGNAINHQVKPGSNDSPNGQLVTNCDGVIDLQKRQEIKTEPTSPLDASIPKVTPLFPNLNGGTTTRKVPLLNPKPKKRSLLEDVPNNLSPSAPKVTKKVSPVEPRVDQTLNLCTMSWEELLKSTNFSESDELGKLEIEHCKLQLLHENYQKKLAELNDAEKPLRRQMQLVSSLIRQLTEESS